MELIIDISEEEYRWIKKSDKNVFTDVASKECMLHAIKNATPLPRGHGQVNILDKITNLFNRWNNGEIDDNQYHFQMQNLLLFGKELLEAKDADSN